MASGATTEAVEKIKIKSFQALTIHLTQKKSYW